MKNLVFQQLVVISKSKKLGNLFKFNPHLNLITAKNNSFGKSTLAKLLVWTLGCEPYLDPTWKNLEVHCRVDFNIGENNFRIERYKNTIIIYWPDNSQKKYSKISGEYAEEFAKIVGFRALLPQRKKGGGDDFILEIPPPAFYYLPFYIDQQSSWSKTWIGFSSLSQYSDWQKTIIKYHTGYLVPEHFAIQKEIAQENKERKAQIQIQQKIDTAIEIVNTYFPTPSKTIALTNEEFDILKKEVSEDISKLQAEQEELFNIIAKDKTKRTYLLSQLELANIAVDELEKDYLFSIEYHNDDELLCPLCGTIHNNSSPYRASILADKDQAIKLVQSLKKEIELIDKNLSDKNIKITILRSKINQIRNKYISKDLVLEKSSIGIDDINIFDMLTVKNVEKHVQQARANSSLLAEENELEIERLKQKQKQLLSKEQCLFINNNFLKYLNDYIDKLNAKGVNLKSIKSPIDYNKLHGSGGAAESTRGLLAYYMAVLKLIEEAENEVFASIIIDTPNQQEQADFNYKNILNFLINTIPPQTQLILCAMDCKEINCFKEKANVIELDEEKILKSSEFIKAKKLLNMDIYL
ncbi:hypothetical protein [Snodgrassella communis]|uniref:Rad50/SbcC-type AAA domain-containing protein n=1 Tax=Snodgrassella alvi TaxID=1196083 RepID=A0A2N9XQ33_9NEIS|nr:hypothetical protein [Snodgrassella communis]PIT50438.1 hypothetical protein BHC48_06990 [Snodgrassella communis]